MNVLAISSLLASLVILAIGASVLLRDRTRRTYTSFAAFTFMVSAWHLCNFIAMATREPLVEWLALWPAATIPPVALRFFREFLAEPVDFREIRPNEHVDGLARLGGFEGVSAREPDRAERIARGESS